MRDSTRFFILTPGRTGSTLLAAILADCGANFGIPVAETWNRESGEFEHRWATKATRYTVAMRRLGYWVPAAPVRYLYLWYRRAARMSLAKALNQAQFVKVAHGHTLFGPAMQLGYEPKVILSTRSFPDYARSTAEKDRGVKFFQDIRDEYIDTLQNGLMSIQLFGGSIVNFDELTNLTETGWAERLSALTGISTQTLLEAREHRVQPSQIRKQAIPQSAEAERLYSEILEQIPSF